MGSSLSFSILKIITIPGKKVWIVLNGRSCFPFATQFRQCRNKNLRNTIVQQMPFLLKNFTIRYRGKTATKKSLPNLFLRGINNALPLDEMRRLYQTRLFQSAPSVVVHFSVLKEDSSNPDTGSKVIHEQTQFCHTSAELDETLDRVLASDCIQNLASDEHWICKVGYKDIDKLVRRPFEQKTAGKKEENYG